ncbi:type I-G CRISPR-associated protein Csb2 [Planctopirus hydrillae]|uniref:Type I-U CRISPR-associated protein Cas5/Cas6 n=1 Tax=Planctopirus hydrillae TaxID=1841610 RepID=A0A1C3EFR8_9PLAN|nr:type I-U CRISPR-associated protein Csb2 [Planctopirus hydrillae]ODA32078.1 type I-U CRISPR-associated protein Cas5/Cas6 [Planctopirus hydrillae]
MIVVSLKFPTRKFHATPWGRQVNEGVVEWPPSPWRLLRALVAVWHHKFPDVPESEMEDLVTLLASSPPRFHLPPASQGHTRHYMPINEGSNEKRTKVFDTFVALCEDDPVIVTWPELELTSEQKKLLENLLSAMSYFGRAESWVEAELLNECSIETDIYHLKLGEPAPEGFELIKTLLPTPAEELAAWHATTLNQLRERKLNDLIQAAYAKGKPTEGIKLSKKDELVIQEAIPASVLGALHADTSELRKAGWNQPPGSQSLNYIRPFHAFASFTNRRKPDSSRKKRPTVAQFLVSSPVRPRLTDTLTLGNRIRKALMCCSKKIRQDDNTSIVFSGKGEDGKRLKESHAHAHILCESNDKFGRITHATIFAPKGFDHEDELAFARLAKRGLISNEDPHDIQMILVGIGQPTDFQRGSLQLPSSRTLATSRHWISRTPYVPTRHMKFKQADRENAVTRHRSLVRELQKLIRWELKQRDHLAHLADEVMIHLLIDQPLSGLKEAGTYLGGQWTPWLKFQLYRRSGGGQRSSGACYGFRLTFPEPVTGPIALGYGCHYGLGLFSAERVGE